MNNYMISRLKECCEDYLKYYDEYDKVKYLSRYTDDLESTKDMIYNLLMGGVVQLYMFFEVMKL